MSRRRIDLESELNNLVKKFGLDYMIVVAPRSKSRKLGKVDENNKIIYIYTDDSDLAYKILLHEILEIKLRPLINKYIDLINLLMKYIEDNLYLEKERAIDEIISNILNLNI